MSHVDLLKGMLRVRRRFRRRSDPFTKSDIKLFFDDSFNSTFRYDNFHNYFIIGALVAFPNCSSRFDTLISVFAF